jgi:hypothetical protein
MTKDLNIEILLKEYELINQKIERFVGNQFLYTQGTLALVGGYIVFLIEGAGSFESGTNDLLVQVESTKFYLQFLPYLMLTILMGIAYQFQRTLGLQGYKQYLEELINKKADENLISYSHIGMHFMVSRILIAKANWLIYILIYAATIALAYYKPPHPIGEGFLISHIGLGVLLLVIVYWQVNGYTEKVKKAAWKLHKADKKVSHIKL